MADVIVAHSPITIKCRDYHDLCGEKEHVYHFLSLSSTEKIVTDFLFWYIPTMTIHAGHHEEGYQECRSTLTLKTMNSELKTGERDGIMNLIQYIILLHTEQTGTKCCQRGLIQNSR